MHSAEEIRRAVNDEIARAYHGLGAPDEAVLGIGEDRDRTEVTESLARFGASPELLSIIVQADCTDEQLLERLRSYNDRGYAREPDPILTSRTAPFRIPSVDT